MKKDGFDLEKWTEIYNKGKANGIALVFRAIQNEVDDNYTGVAKAGAQYHIDKVKYFFREELEGAGQ